jgi:hypothetical protein
MDKNERNLTEQEAPEKNTDHAFVKVGDDGKPVMPDDKKERQQPDDEPAEGSLKNR